MVSPELEGQPSESSTGVLPNHRAGRSLRGLAALVAALAIGALLAVCFVARARSRHWRAHVSATVSVGMMEEDVVLALGPPDWVISDAGAYTTEPLSRFDRPREPIRDRVIAYAIAGEILYVGVDRQGRVTWLHWARRKSA